MAAPRGIGIKFPVLRALAMAEISEDQTCLKVILTV
jgi:hypothetical protein